MNCIIITIYNHILGVIMGGCIKYYTNVAIQFDSNIFFYLVLPPVIFSAGNLNF